ncbi:MAG: two-component system, NarL family, nitrate/nitrite response regulator NarL [Methyloprofundus sp.]|nr:MAG: two-component system, NarL family, nitrate/nitrite response regulator NarL [Methyloprofundus sp.]
MTSIIIAHKDKDSLRFWVDALNPIYPLIFIDNIATILSNDQYHDKSVLLLLDAALIDEIKQLTLICECIDKVILVGEGVSDDQQVQFIQQGALGYSDIAIEQQLMERAIQGVLNNEIWLKRHLIPQILKGVVRKKKLSRSQDKFHQGTQQIQAVLTEREVEVMELVYSGEDNLTIANVLSISNRTVKAHLSAIYRKLDVQDRFQLLVFLKNIHISHLSS